MCIEERVVKLRMLCLGVDQPKKRLLLVQVLVVVLVVGTRQLNWRELELLGMD